MCMVTESFLAGQQGVYCVTTESCFKILEPILARSLHLLAAHFPLSSLLPSPSTTHLYTHSSSVSSLCPSSCNPFFIKLNLDSHIFSFPGVHVCISSMNQHSLLLRKVGGCRLSLFIWK